MITGQLTSITVRSWVRLWARPRVLPEQFQERINSSTETQRHFCFVMETDAAADYEALRQLLGKQPWNRLTANNAADERIICLQRWIGWLRNRLDHRLPDDLRQLVIEQFSMTPNDIEVELIPVSVFWGRAPDKESSFFRLPFATTWGDDMGIIRRMLAVVFNGRSLVIQFGEPVALRSLFTDAPDTAYAARRVARICRGLLHRQRTAVIGLDCQPSQHRCSSIADADRASGYAQ